MSDEELQQWLRDNSAGIYRPARHAADRIATLTAERDALVALIEQYQDAITEDDNVLDHREAMFLAVQPQLKEQDDE